MWAGSNVLRSDCTRKLRAFCAWVNPKSAPRTRMRAISPRRCVRAVRSLVMVMAPRRSVLDRFWREWGRGFLVRGRRLAPIPHGREHARAMLVRQTLDFVGVSSSQRFADESVFVLSPPDLTRKARENGETLRQLPALDDPLTEPCVVAFGVDR